MIDTSSQDFVEKHLNVHKGACLSMCAKFMCTIGHPTYADMPTKKQYLETAQWVQEKGGKCDLYRVDERAMTESW
jgi:hypothetical protein